MHCPLLLLLILASIPILTHGDDIIVVGGGVAGLAAARMLVDEGGHDVIILEAKNIYCGRIATNTRLGHPIDLGAQFLAGAQPLNPVWRLAEELGIPRVHVEYSDLDMYNGMTGVQYTEEEREEGRQLYLQTIDGCVDEIPNVDYDAALRDSITLSGYEEEFQDPRVQWHWTSAEGSYGADLTNISAKLFWEGSSISGPHEVFPDGYTQICDAIVNGDASGGPVLDVRLTHQVTEVNVGADSVTVTTADGQDFTADNVIVTVSLGVLKAGDITFEPSLSDDMQEAMDAFGFGILDKLAMEFDQPFWEEATNFYGLTPENEADMGFGGSFLDYQKVMGYPIMMFEVSGKGAEEMSTWSDEECVELALDQMRVIWGEEAVDSSTLVDFVRSNWRNDENIRGCYSYYKTGVLPHHRDALGETHFDGKLLFAGEHTALWYGFVHGAYAEGERAASEILENKAATPKDAPVHAAAASET